MSTSLQFAISSVVENCRKERRVLAQNGVKKSKKDLGLPTEMTAIEQSQANGRAEQRVRALRERLQIMDEDARRLSAEIILDHPAAQWAVRQAEWIQNFLVKSDVDLSGGGRIKIHATRCTHGRQSTRGNVVGTQISGWLGAWSQRCRHRFFLRQME